MASNPTRGIVVTGAGSGIGRELTIQTAAPGVEQWLVGRREQRLKETAAAARERGAKTHVVVFDLAEVDAAARLLEERFGSDGARVDDVFLCAAVSLFGEVQDVKTADWRHLHLVNLLSPIQWSTHFHDRMRQQDGGGRVVIVGSLAGHAGYPTATPYATMKAGLVGYFKSVQHEGASDGVAFHLVAPGYVGTEIYDTAIYRNCTRETILGAIEKTGFKMLPAERAAELILAGVRRGRPLITYPGYSTILTWLAPRAPWLIDLIHRRVIAEFRKSSRPRETNG
jgi:short-subunit dehydrogenase